MYKVCTSASAFVRELAAKICNSTFSLELLELELLELLELLEFEPLQPAKHKHATNVNAVTQAMTARNLLEVFEAFLLMLNPPNKFYIIK